MRAVRGFQFWQRGVCIEQKGELDKPFTRQHRTGARAMRLFRQALQQSYFCQIGALSVLHLILAEVPISLC